jgi:hypothetical protein
MRLGRDNLDKYLTTDDLILYLNKSDKIDVIEKKTIKEKKKLKLNKKHIYVSIVILAVLHLVFTALPMVFKDSSNVLLGHQYEIVFSKDQESTQRLVGSVVRIENIDPQTIEVGDHVLVYGLYENNYYWEVTVVDINFANQTVDATYDDVIRNTYTYDEIEGLISQEANLMGIFYYTASTPR